MFCRSPYSPDVNRPVGDRAGLRGARKRHPVSLLARRQGAEVIVVAGDEATRKAARELDVCDQVVPDKGTGAGAARNRGAEAASGDVLLFTDADTKVPPTWV